MLWYQNLRTFLQNHFWVLGNTLKWSSISLVCWRQQVWIGVILSRNRPLLLRPCGVLQNQDMTGLSYGGSHVSYPMSWSPRSTCELSPSACEVLMCSQTPLWDLERDTQHVFKCCQVLTTGNKLLFLGAEGIAFLCAVCTISWRQHSRVMTH